MLLSGSLSPSLGITLIAPLLHFYFSQVFVHFSENNSFS